MAGDRFPYIGNQPGLLSFPPAPLQAETVTYLNRFSGSITQTYKNALNRLIYSLKQAGIYSTFQDLWLCVAPTQADSLRNLISAARDATLTGSPAFVAPPAANAGFSVVSTTATVNFPFSTSGVAAASSGVLYAGLLDGSLNGSSNPPLVGSTVANLGAIAAKWFLGTSDAGPSISNNLCVVPTINGGNNLTVTAGGGVNVASPNAAYSSAVPPSVIHTSPISAVGPGSAHRILAYGIIPAGLTATNYRLLCQLIQQFLFDVGAYT